MSSEQVPDADSGHGPDSDAPDITAPDSLVQRFADAARANGTRVEVVADDDAARALVVELVGGRSLLRDDIELLAGLDLPAAPPDPWDAEVGLSQAHAGAAETGTVALVQGPGTPRRTSLLVHDHLVLLRRGDLVESYQELVDAVAHRVPRPTGVQFVSGHSRSGDIESAMIHGMHGPAELVVIVLP